MQRVPLIQLGGRKWEKLTSASTRTCHWRKSPTPDTTVGTPIYPQSQKLSQVKKSPWKRGDSFDGQITSSTTADDLRTTSLRRLHPLTGPIYVEGAEPGDLIAVHIEDVKPTLTGYTVIMPGFGFLRDLFTEPFILHWTMSDGYATCPELPGVRVPGAPFMGVMGLAPSHELMATIKDREGHVHRRGGPAMLPDSSEAVPATEPIASEAIRTISPQEFGGNMDIKQHTAGTVLYLPVYQTGGLFSVGDAHFAQGDGETCGTAIENAGHVHGAVRDREG